MDREFAEVWYSWTGTAPKPGVRGPGLRQNLVFMDQECAKVWYSWTGLRQSLVFMEWDYAKVRAERRAMQTCLLDVLYFNLISCY